MKTTRKQKTYFHIIEECGYYKKGWQGYYDTLEEAEERMKTLMDYFPNNDYWILQDSSKKEPNIITI